MDDDKLNVSVYISAWSQLISSISASKIIANDDEAGLTSIVSNTPLDFANLHVASRPCINEIQLMNVLKLARERVRLCKPHPSLIALCVSDSWLPSNWREILERNGVRLHFAQRGMMATALLPPSRPSPEQITFRLSSEDDDVGRAIAAINADAYGSAVEAYSCVQEMCKPPSLGVVAFAENDVPVSCCVVTMIDDARVYISWVATAHAARRRGFAQAVIRRALYTLQSPAKNVQRSIWLHASLQGAPLYRSLGFTDASELSLFKVDD